MIGASEVAAPEDKLETDHWATVTPSGLAAASIALRMAIALNMLRRLPGHASAYARSGQLDGEPQHGTAAAGLLLTADCCCCTGRQIAPVACRKCRMATRLY